MGSETLERLIEALGPETFNRLVASVERTREKGRLRFWQEEFLKEVASKTGVVIAIWDEFIAVFENAELQPIPREPVTKEGFLRRLEKHPFDFALSPEEIPSEWMAEAWRIQSVREARTYDLARDVSKSGSLAATDDYLRLLARALSIQDQLDLFMAIRERSPTRECEFRGGFERAFPETIDLLPPRLTDDDLIEKYGIPKALLDTRWIPSEQE